MLDTSNALHCDNIHVTTPVDSVMHMVNTVTVHCTGYVKVQKNCI